MKFLVSAVILLCCSSCTYLFGQKQSEPNCRLQEMAIEAALGDTLAQYNLGVVFFRGDLIAQDYSKAATLWRLASNAGKIEASNNLGYLTYNGKGIKADYAEGVRLWRMAAEKGFAESQIHLADAYSDGRYLKLNYIEAYAWAKSGRHSAEQIENPAIKVSLIKMADKSLNIAAKNLSASETAIAEKKAAEYVAKFVQK